MFQKVLYYSGFIFSCYAFVFILWQNQAYKFQRFKFHAFSLTWDVYFSASVGAVAMLLSADICASENIFPSFMFFELTGSLDRGKI